MPERNGDKLMQTLSKTSITFHGNRSRRATTQLTLSSYLHEICLWTAVDSAGSGHSPPPDIISPGRSPSWTIPLLFTWCMTVSLPSPPSANLQCNLALTCTQLIPVDRLGSGIRVSASSQKKSPLHGSVMVRTPRRRLIRVRSIWISVSFHILSLTTKEMS